MNPVLRNQTCHAIIQVSELDNIIDYLLQYRTWDISWTKLNSIYGLTFVIRLSLQQAEWSTLFLIRVLKSQIVLLFFFCSRVDSFFPSAPGRSEMHIKQAFLKQLIQENVKPKTNVVGVGSSITFPLRSHCFNLVESHFALQWAPQIILGHGNGERNKMGIKVSRL